ncbi:hypothetical protein [Streptomyces sp. NPDC007905]|uniref:hypothetical protein n=1 Tax=Streptomyces sp. NPDC007905 TaxID=3364788 RepID=UPI0036ED889F
MTRASVSAAQLLLPEVPDLPGAQVATYYHPAGEGLDIGGDFYDVFPLADQTWAFQARRRLRTRCHCCTTTALVRHTAGAPLLPGPDAVAQAINKALLDRPNSHGTGFVTLVYGYLAPAVRHDAHLTLRPPHSPRPRQENPM